MLKWRPANTKEAVLLIQHAIVHYPEEVDWSQCHYYVTKRDIAAELGKPEETLTNPETIKALADMGFNPDRVYDNVSLESDKTTGFFVTESALERLGIDLPEWNQPSFSTGRNRSKRDRIR